MRLVNEVVPVEQTLPRAMEIARLIARHHGGRIGARNLPDSRGVEFWVELPPGPGPGSGPGK